MPEFSIFVLVCTMAIAHQDCQPDTAADVIQGPKVANEMRCGFQGQTLIAGTAVKPRPGLEYQKIICLRSKVISDLKGVRSQLEEIK